MTRFQIRLAEARDAEAICIVLTRSVREICAPDYGHNEAVLDLWCSNKTPDNLRSWIADPENYFIVAVDENDQPVGAGLMETTGEILLCYVVPEVLHQGVGRALLDDMVSKAHVLGVEKITLGSTITAKPFYERHGFVVTEEHLDPAKTRIPHYVMEKLGSVT